MSRNRMIDADSVRTAGLEGRLAASMRLSPDTCGFAASPRIRVVGAPVGRMCVGASSLGATENSPRGNGPVAVLAGTRAVFVSSVRTEGVGAKAAWESRGMWMTRCGRRAWNAAPSRCLRNGFARDRYIEIETGSPEEGAPCRWITIGTEGRHDNVPLAPGWSLRQIPESSRTHRIGA